MILLGGIFYVIFAGLMSQALGPYDYNKDHAEQPRVQVVSPAASAPEVKP